MKHENLVDQTSIKLRDNEIEKLKNVLKRIVEVLLFLTSAFYLPCIPHNLNLL